MSDPLNDLEERTAADTDGEVSRVLTKLEDSGNNLRILRVLANAPHAFRPFVQLSNALIYRSTFSADIREIVILHLAARRNVQYEWKEHLVISKAAGITSEQSQAILKDHADSVLFSDAQLLAIRVASEIVEERSLSAASWSAICQQWGSEGGLEFILIVAMWGGLVPTIIEALGLDDPNG